MIKLAYTCGALAVLAYLLLASIGSRTGPIGIIRGVDGRLSTSKFQLFLWTGVVVFAYVTLYVAWRAHCAAQCGTLPAIPSNVLLAMGFSAVTATSAKGITSAYVSSGRIVKGFSSAFGLSDLVLDDSNNRPDLGKVQMLIWTGIAAVTYLYGVAAILPTFGAGTNVKFPDIDAAMMTLMGLGQGAYLGAKIVSSSSAKLASIQPPREKAGADVTLIGTGFGYDAGTVKFGDSVALPQAGAFWTDSAVKVTVPNGLTSGTTVSVGVLLPGVDGPALTSNMVPFTYD